MQHMSRRVVDSLFSDAMLLADEARAYFEDAGLPDRARLSGAARVSYACESLKVTTRLMHVVAWLLTQRAVMAGELTPGDAIDPARRLGDAALIDPQVLALLPERAQALIMASDDLFGRVGRIEAGQRSRIASDSPVQALRDRLAQAF